MTLNVPVEGDVLGASGITPNHKFGVWGDAGGGDNNDEAGDGVVGTSFNGSGVVGISGDRAVYGIALGIGEPDKVQGGIGVYGENNRLAGIGVAGRADNSGIAILAESAHGIGVSSVVGGNEENNPIGVLSRVIRSTRFGTAVIAEHEEGGTSARLCTALLAGDFKGDIHVNGAIHASGNFFNNGGGFRVDHSLEPTSKYLTHSFVASPDMKNIYDGVAILDSKGKAVVSLPAWFEALNKDFRYQLTAIGAAAPNLHVAQELLSNHFKIAGGSPGLKISWQVTGIRNDAWARANRLQVEADKPHNECIP